MDGKAVCRIWRPLSGGCKNHRTAQDKQRNPRKARTSQLCRLLFELNRRMPNGTYDGVRGLEVNLYSIVQFELKKLEKEKMK